MFVPLKVGDKIIVKKSFIHVDIFEKDEICYVAGIDDMAIYVIKDSNRTPIIPYIFYHIYGIIPQHEHESPIYELFETPQSLRKHKIQKINETIRNEYR